MRHRSRIFVLLISLALAGLAGIRTSYPIELGGREDKHFLSGWGDRVERGGATAREIRPGAVFHFHGLSRWVDHRIRIRWSAAHPPEILRLAPNGAGRVVLRSRARFQEDAFDLPPAPQDCLLIRFHPSAPAGTTVQGIAIEPARPWARPPAAGLVFLLIVPQLAVFLCPGSRRALPAALAAALATGLIAWMASRPADYLYASVYRPLLPVVLAAGSVGCATLASRDAFRASRNIATIGAAALLLGLTVALTYGYTISFGFIREDFVFLHPPTWSRIGGAFTGSWLSPNPFLQDFYRPAVILSYAGDFLLYGPWAPGFHLTNLLLLWGSALVLFLILDRLAPHSGWALAASLFFVLHPFNYVAASWVSARTDTLALLFYLGAAAAWPYRGAAAITLAAGALLSKEMAVTLPGVLLLLDVVASPRSASLRQRLQRYGVLAALWIAYLTFLWWRFRSVREFATREWRFGLLADRLLEISSLSLLPSTVELLRGREWIFLLLASFLLFLAFRRSADSPDGASPLRLLLAGWLWIALVSLPILNEVGFEFHRMGPWLAAGASLVVLGAIALVPARRGARLAAGALFAIWLAALYVEDLRGALDQHPYSEGMVLQHAWEHRRWSPYLPELPARLLWLRSSGRADHSWPIYRRDPPESYQHGAEESGRTLREQP